MVMLDQFRSIDDLPLGSRRVFIRVDFDAPIEAGKVVNDDRLRAALPTVVKARAQGARVILGSRLARTRGSGAAPSLEPVALRLSELLETEVYLPDDCVGEAARKVVQDLRPGQVCMLENLAAHDQEEANDEVFARKLADLADVYVGEAPRELRRTHASVTTVPRLVRERGIGYLVAAELAAIERLREHPFVAVIGGDALDDKLSLLESLIGRADALCVGGAVGNALLTARGNANRGSLSPVLLSRARALLTRARERKVTVVLPVDLKVARNAEGDGAHVVGAADVPDGYLAVDVGPRTVELFRSRVEGAKSVLFAGPLGAVDHGAFRSGTLDFARALAQAPAYTMVSGASNVATLAGEDVTAQFGFVSAGGHSSLELLSGRRLPGLEALRGGGAT